MPELYSVEVEADLDPVVDTVRRAFFPQTSESYSVVDVGGGVVVVGDVEDHTLFLVGREQVFADTSNKALGAPAAAPFGVGANFCYGCNGLAVPRVGDDGSNFLWLSRVLGRVDPNLVMFN